MRTPFPVHGFKMKITHLMVETVAIMFTAIQILDDKTNIHSHLITSSVWKKGFHQYDHTIIEIVKGNNIKGTDIAKIIKNLKCNWLLAKYVRIMCYVIP